MECKLQCQKPDEIVYAMTITATAKEWELIRGQLQDRYPSWTLTGQIDDLLKQARRVYQPTVHPAPCGGFTGSEQ